MELEVTSPELLYFSTDTLFEEILRDNFEPGIWIHFSRSCFIEVEFILWYHYGHLLIKAEFESFNHGLLE